MALCRGVNKAMFNKDESRQSCHLEQSIEKGDVKTWYGCTMSRVDQMLHVLYKGEVH
jgi:hypothetical protein